MMRRKRSRSPVQRELFRTHGGKREGAGRPKKRASRVSHSRRPALKARFPVHITYKVLGGVPHLRGERSFARMQRAFFGGHDRFGMRLCEFSVQGNHVHLIVE